MRTLGLLLAGLLLSSLSSSLGGPRLARASSAPRVCSGGIDSGQACAGDSSCSDGVCVRLLAVCDGGDDDRFDCRCPGGACVREVACEADERLGTCVGGRRAGSCCDPFFSCAAGRCTATEKLCLDGPEKGFGCLRAAHCPQGSCATTAKVCRGGIAAGDACVDDAECGRGFCRARMDCVGDCDRSGEVTVDELITMVSIGLGSQEATACVVGDANRDGAITVDEIIAAVNNGLRGCVPRTGQTPASETPIPGVRVTPTALQPS